MFYTHLFLEGQFPQQWLCDFGWLIKFIVYMTVIFYLHLICNHLDVYSCFRSFHPPIIPRNDSYKDNCYMLLLKLKRIFLTVPNCERWQSKEQFFTSWVCTNTRTVNHNKNNSILFSLCIWFYWIYSTSGENQQKKETDRR